MDPRSHPLWAAHTGLRDLLKSVGANASLADDRFPARNILLDELVTEQRLDDYRSTVEGDSRDYCSWREAHGDYVADRLRLTGFPFGRPNALHQRDPTECPESFRTTPSLARFGATDPDVTLTRVVSLRAVADANDMSLTDARSELANEKGRDHVVRDWSASLPIEPVFATFWWHVRDLLPVDPVAAPADWANTLRDRLGLSYYDPDARKSAIDVVVLCYPVSAARKVIGLRGQQPLAVPTSIDSDLYPAFCPTPQGSKFGQVVDLNAGGARPIPEVIHPTAQWTGKHVFRQGTITSGVGALDLARGIHLTRLREDTGRADYAQATDSDLIV